MTPSDRLHAARVATHEGRFEEALREFVWFHEHALEEEPSLYGVRLSFALDSWMELAQVYPEARRVLEEVRDRTTNALIGGATDRRAFHDLVAINGKLGCEHRTYELFRELATLNPSFASSCADLALRSTVRAGDFALAARFLTDPERRVRFLSQRFNDDVRDCWRPPDRLNSRDQFHVDFYSSEVKLLITSLDGVDRTAESARIKSLAVELVESATVREAVRGALESPA